ncbi:MAG: ABC transporter substrate-binding protein [Treponemataceae bacterium]
MHNDRKKVAGALLIVLVFLFLGCSGKRNPPAPPVKLVVAYPEYQKNAELSIVQEKIKEMALRKIGVELALMPIPRSDWTIQTDLLIANRTPVDLMTGGTLPFMKLSARILEGKLKPLDELLKEYGAGVVSAMDAEFLAAGRFQGKQFIVPTVRDFASSYSLLMRGDILREAGIKPGSIRNLDDVETVLIKVKKAKPDIVPLIPYYALSTVMDGLQTWDKLGGTIGELPHFGDGTLVINIYETEEYRDLLRRLHRWYRAGLIHPDAATNKTTWFDQMKTGSAFAVITASKPGFDSQQSLLAGREMVSAELIPPFSTTDNVIKFGWTMPATGEHPLEAMKLLSLLYSDAEFFTLLTCGIEGRHYVRTADGFIDFPPGLNSKTVAYSYVGTSWLFGNQFLGPVFKGDPATIWRDTADFNRRAIKSKALGFVFDETPVKETVAACKKTLVRYLPGLENGVLNPDIVLPEFLSALTTAGSDKIIAEKQRQLNVWLEGTADR